MKITLEPTEDVGTSPTTTHPRVVIEVPFDDLDIWDYWDSLIKPCLLASGFSEEVINKLLEGIK